MNFHTKQEQWGLSALWAGQTLPLKEMDAMLQKKIRFFFKGIGDCGSLHCVCLLIFFYEFCLPLRGLPHHLAERTEVRLFELIYVKRSKSFFFFLLKGQKDQNEGQAIFWRHMEKKIDVYASGCCSQLFIKQAKRRVATSTLESFKHFEGGRLKRMGLVSLLTSSKLAMGTSQVLGQETGLMIWDSGVNLFAVPIWKYPLQSCSSVRSWCVLIKNIGRKPFNIL